MTTKAKPEQKPVDQKRSAGTQAPSMPENVGTQGASHPDRNDASKDGTVRRPGGSDAKRGSR